jgi:hypothetical protein
MCYSLQSHVALYESKRYRFCASNTYGITYISKCAYRQFCNVHLLGWRASTGLKGCKYALAKPWKTWGSSMKHGVYLFICFTRADDPSIQVTPETGGLGLYTYSMRAKLKIEIRALEYLWRVWADSMMNRSKRMRQLVHIGANVIEEVEIVNGMIDRGIIGHSRNHIQGPEVQGFNVEPEL